MNGFRSLAFGLVALLGTLGPARSAGLTDLYFFGDSLTDEGRNGRTAPIMWPGVARNALGVSVGANYAIGGAVTSNQPCAAYGDCSFLGQSNSFAGAGGAVGANAGAGVWIGTNNITIESSRGAAPSAIVASATADVKTGLTTLVGSGVRNLYLLGVYDLSLTNAYQLAAVDTPQVRASAATASQQYNASLATLTTPGATTTFFNMATYITFLQRNAAANGFTRILPLNPGQGCDASCQQSSIFADTIHMTSKTQALIGAYVASGNPIYNSYPLVYGAFASDVAGASQAVAADARIAKGSVDDFSRGLLNQQGASHLAPKSARVGEFSAFAYGAVGGARVGGAQFNNADWFTPSFTAGVSYLLRPELRIGAALGLSESFSRTSGSLSSRAFQGAVFASVERAQGYVDAVAAVGWDSLSRTRSGSFGSLASRTRATTWQASARAAYYAYSAGAFHIGPVLEASVSRTSLGAFTESGDPFYATAAASQAASDFVTRAGLEARMDATSALSLRPFADVMLERHWTAAPTYGSYLASLPTQVLSPTTIPYPKAAVSGVVGAEYGLADSWTGRVTTSATLGTGGYRGYALTAGLAHGF